MMKWFRRHGGGRYRDGGGVWCDERPQDHARQQGWLGKAVAGLRAVQGADARHGAAGLLPLSGG